jgi:hypothetical protein
MDKMNLNNIHKTKTLILLSKFGSVFRFWVKFPTQVKKGFFEK